MFDSYIKARYPVLMVVSPEEARVELELANTLKELKWKVVVWSHTDGFIDSNGKTLDEVDDPVAALSKIRGPESTNTFGEKVVFLFRDLHPFFGVPKIARLIRDIAREFKTAKKTLIMISPLNELPIGLQRDVTLLEFGLPERAIIGTMIDRFVSENKTVVGDVAKDEVFAIVEACMGLTTVEAENAMAKGVVDWKKFTKEDPKSKVQISTLVMSEKANAIKKSGVLEWYPAKQGMDDIGGLVVLKEWLSIRKLAFTEEARKYGLPAPRGVMLTGIPGTGKSLAAKACAANFGVPLIKFDVGRVFGGLVGQSLAPDQEIVFYTPDGAKRMTIEQAYEMKPEACVESYTPSMKMELQHVTGFIRHERKSRLVKIKTASGRSVNVTEDHSIFTIGSDGRLAEVKPMSLKPGDPIAVPVGVVDTDAVQEFDLIQLIRQHEESGRWCVADAYATLGREAVREAVGPKSLSGFEKSHCGLRLSHVGELDADVKLSVQYSDDEFDRKLKLTPELMELLGWFVAEGSFSKTGVPRFCVQTDEASLVCDLAASCGLRSHTYPCSDRDAVDIWVGGVGFGRILYYLGFAKHRVPAWIFGASVERRCAFLRGFFSGDGGISGHNIESSQSRGKIIHDFADLLATVGIHARIYPVKSSSHFHRNAGTRRLSISTPSMIRRFAKMVGFTHSRKNEGATKIGQSGNGPWIPVFDALRGCEKEKRVENYKAGLPDSDRISGDWINIKTARRLMPSVDNWEIVFEKVKSVTVCEDQPQFVYDISVKANQNFVSGGILCHNSEANMRVAIQTAEAVGRCVLWVDEIEKAFAGMSSSGQTDSGVSARVFGSFITWMQEKTAPVFIVATCNKIDGLPPELLRKGRFDEIFYVDLPDEKEREEILKIHITKRGRDPKKFDAQGLKECASNSEGYSGAELEEAVISGLYTGFYRKEELNDMHILSAIMRTVPLSRSRRGDLESMKKWASDFAQNANHRKDEEQKSRKVDA